MSEKFIMGIDPSFSSSGLAVIAGRQGLYRYVDGCCIFTNEKLSLESRLHTIHSQVQHMLNQYKPCLVAIEGCFVHTSAATAIKLGMVQGVVRLAIEQQGSMLREYSPRYVRKMVAGKGSLTKQEIEHWMKIFLKDFQSVTNEHIVDAAAVALCGAREERENDS